MKKLLIMTALLLPVSAFAHGDKPTMTADSVKVATDKFVKEDAALIPDYTGVKGWPDADIVRVKIYLTNNRTLSYECHEMNHVVMCDKK